MGKEEVYNYVKRFPGCTSDDVALCLGQSRKSCSVSLRKLVSDKELVRVEERDRVHKMRYRYYVKQHKNVLHAGYATVVGFEVR